MFAVYECHNMLMTSLKSNINVYQFSKHAVVIAQVFDQKNIYMRWPFQTTMTLPEANIRLCVLMQ